MMSFHSTFPDSQNFFFDISNKHKIRNENFPLHSKTIWEVDKYSR